MALVDTLPDVMPDTEIDQGGGAAAITVLPAGSLSISVPVAGLVDALGATLTVTEDQTATGGGIVTVGPLPALVVQNTDGTSTLTIYPAGIIVGAVTGTANYSIGGEAQPSYAFSGVVDALGPVDLDVPGSPPLVSIGSGGTVLQAGATEWVHVLLSGTDSATGVAVDLTQYDVSMAITQGAAGAGDFLPATWLSRTALPAGTYARLLVGPLGAITLGTGNYRVYVQFTAGDETVQRRVDGLLTVAGSASLGSTAPPALDSAPPSPSLAAILAAQSQTLAAQSAQLTSQSDTINQLRSQLMVFINNAPTGSDPVVALNATSTLTMPVVNTAYRVALTANAITTLPAATGTGRKLTFDIQSLGSSTYALALNGTDGYDGTTTPAALIGAGNSFALRDIAAGVWAIE